MSSTKLKVEWIAEKEAAELIGLRPSTLRRYVKPDTGKHPYTNINFTCLNGRNFKYNKYDIEKVFLDNSTIGRLTA